MDPKWVWGKKEPWARGLRVDTLNDSYTYQECYSSRANWSFFRVTQPSFKYWLPAWSALRSPLVASQAQKFAIMFYYIWFSWSFKKRNRFLNFIASGVVQNKIDDRVEISTGEYKIGQCPRTVTDNCHMLHLFVLQGNVSPCFGAWWCTHRVLVVCNNIRF